MIEKIRKVLKGKGGFTLVELLVVIVVLGILSGIGVQQFGSVQRKANETAIKANHRVLVGAIQLAIFDNDGDTNISSSGVETFIEGTVDDLSESSPGTHVINYTTRMLTSSGSALDAPLVYNYGTP